MLAYAVAIFLGSFLVFLVQPLMGKYILPWYGGSPAVWTTCLLFFQIMLVAGYAYAHALATWLRPRAQAAVHLAVLAVSWLCLPIIPAVEWRQASVENPSLAILLLLTVTVGGPYLVLSASAPLLQKWFSLTQHQSTPYRLYALSNVASLGALLAYPFLIERSLFLDSQCWFWTALYGAYSLSLVLCAVLVIWRAPPAAAADGAPADAAQAAGGAGDRLDFCLWILLAACGTLLLMATTNQLTQDVVPVPFLWILPLSLYLLSFIICFDRPVWYSRTLFSWLFIISMLLVTGDFLLAWQSFALKVVLYAGNLFAGCMCCHGELVARRPAAARLTTFYLAIAAGGALGGFAVAIVAPAIFNEFREFWVGNVAVCLLLLACRRADSLRQLSVRYGAPVVALGAGALACALLGVLVYSNTWDLSSGQNQLLAARRNFYGVLQINRETPPPPRLPRISMSHGTTTHGFQFTAPELAQRPTSYYERESGVGRTLAAQRQRVAGKPLKVGVVGLGAGTLAAYAGPGDTFVFYEINPLVKELCREHFTFIQAAEARHAQIDVLVGDARLLLEEQLAQGQPQQFDVLVIDAFSSDAIPVHLLTRECFDIYLKHLAAEGVLALHVSNRHVDLEPVVVLQAQRLGMPALMVRRLASRSPGAEDTATPSDWIILTRNEAVRAGLRQTPHVTEATAKPHFSEWTDNYSSLFEVLR